VRVEIPYVDQGLDLWQEELVKSGTHAAATEELRAVTEEVQ
jgi:hypothetical protein